MLRTFLVLVLFVAVGANAQKEAANWYFGERAGLNFDNGLATPLTDGVILSIEGCSTISDGEGNLLFYTDGRTVWNRLHQEMLNGNSSLTGSSSSTQSGLIIQNPSSPNLYYIFTPDDALSPLESPIGFHYSVIDIDADGGFGAVVQLNQELLADASEKVTAIRNYQGNFYWVVAHFRDTFYAYKVDENGVDTNAVVSQVGPTIDGRKNIRGALKLSPDGKKVAMANVINEPLFESSLYLFDFDNETGVLSNPQNLSGNSLYYGVSFSPDSSKLYASGLQIQEPSNPNLGELEVVQFDLDASSILQSRTILSSSPGFANVFVSGALELAFDKKIYHSLSGNRLSVIQFPNKRGGRALFSERGQGLGGGISRFGLPGSSQSYFENIGKIENLCLGDITSFTTTIEGPITSISWDFGDPTSFDNNFSTELDPTHEYSETGKYTVKAIVTYPNGVERTFFEFIEIFEPIQVPSILSLQQCDIDGVDDGVSTFQLDNVLDQLNINDSSLEVIFYASEADAIADTGPLLNKEFTTSGPGSSVFARVFRNDDCFELVEVVLETQPMSNLGRYATLDICNGVVTSSTSSADLTEVYDYLRADFSDFDKITLHLSAQEALEEDNILLPGTYSFSEGLTAPEVYFRIGNNGNCAFIGQLQLQIFSEPNFERVVEIELCNGALELQAPDGFQSYNWPDGSTSQRFETQSEGQITVLLNNGNCSYEQIFIVGPEPQIVIDEIRIDDFSRNNSLEIMLEQRDSNQNLRFSIDGGTTFQESPKFTNILPGLYDITITTLCSSIKAEALVGGVRNYFSPNGDDTVDNWGLLNPDFFPGARLSIFDRYGKLLKVVLDNSVGWDGTYQNQNMPSGNYWYRLDLLDGRSIDGFFALRR